MTRRALWLLTFLSLPAAAFAQETSPSPLVLPLGARVRVVSSAGAIRGILLQGDGTAFQIAGGNGVQTVPLAAISRFDLVVERKGNALKGALIGALGYGLLANSFPVDPENCEGGPNFCSRTQAITLGVVGGAGMGALIGHFIKTDRLAPVDISAFRPRPARGAPRAPLAFELALRF